MGVLGPSSTERERHTFSRMFSRHVLCPLGEHRGVSTQCLVVAEAQTTASENGHITREPWSWKSP